MHIVYEVRRQDIEALLRYHHEYSQATAGARLLARRVLPLVVLGAFVVLGVASGLWVYAIMGLASALLLLAVLPRITRWNIQQAIARSLAQGSQLGMLGRHELSLTPTGLLERVGEDAYEYPWEAITQVVRLADRTIIYLGATQAYVLPQAGVVSGDYEGFVREVERQSQRAQCILD